MTRSWLAVPLFFALACAGSDVAPEPECCSVDDLIRLTAAGVPASTLIDTVRVSKVKVVPDSLAVPTLLSGGVDPSVLAAIQDTTCTCPVRTVEPRPAGPAPVDVEPCCTVDWAVARTTAGVPVKWSLHESMMAGTNLPLSASDIERLNGARVPADLIVALNGGPCPCGEQAAPAAATTKQTGPPSLQITIKDPRGRRFEVVNHSTTSYTNITLTANGEYVYRLKKLKQAAGDSMSVSSFVSVKDGSELKKGVMKTLVIKADQGVWSGKF